MPHATYQLGQLKILLQLQIGVAECNDIHYYLTVCDYFQLRYGYTSFPSRE